MYDNDSAHVKMTGMGCNLFDLKIRYAQALQMNPGILARALCDTCNTEVMLYVRALTNDRDMTDILYTETLGTMGLQ